MISASEEIASKASDMHSELLRYLYDIAVYYQGELHADSSAIVLRLPNPESPKRQDHESWPTSPMEASSTTTATTSEPEPAGRPNPRRVVLNDLNQFLREQEQNRLVQDREAQARRQQEFTTGNLPYRNYPEGRPPRP